MLRVAAAQATRRTALRTAVVRSRQIRQNSAGRRDALFARARARRAAQPPPRSRAERREVAKAAEHGLAEPYIEALEHHHVRAG